MFTLSDWFLAWYYGFAAGFIFWGFAYLIVWIVKNKEKIKDDRA